MDATLGDLQRGEAGRGPVRIECSAEVMDGIHAEVSEAFYSVPHGGAETGGVLYGTHDDASLRIAAARPLPCEHALGPSFRLSPGDVKRLEALIEAPRRDRSLSGLEAVGWYHSHTRSDLQLTDADIEVHRRHFPKVWQVALLLRPAPMQPTRIGYFLPDEAGEMSGPHQEGVIATAGARQSKQSAAPASPRRQPAPNSELAPAPEGTAQEQAPRKPRPEFAPVLVPQEPAHRARAWIWVAAVVVAVCVVAAVIWAPWSGKDKSAPNASAGLGLRTTDRAGGEVEVLWNTDSAAIRGARNGTLQIDDGPERQSVLLDAAFLSAGTVTYTRRTKVVKFHLTVVQSDGRTAEQFTTLIGDPLPSPPVPPTEEKAVARAEVAREPAPEKPAPPVRKVAEPPRRDVAKTEPARQPAPQAAKVTPLRQFVPPPQAIQTSRPAAPVAAPPALSASSSSPATAPAPAASASSTVAPPPSALAVAPKPQLAAAPPKPQPPAPKTQPQPPAPKPAAAPITGRWTYSPSSPTGSPFPPEAISISIVETPSGLQGILTGRYRTSKASGLKPDVRFIFHGTPGGPAKFPWTATDGSSGQIEFIRLPNSDSIEVVWYPQDRRFVFDDVLVRSGK